MDSPQLFYTQTIKAHQGQLWGLLQQLEQRFGQLFFWQQAQIAYISAEAVADFFQHGHQRYSQQHLANQFGAVENQQTNPDYYQNAFTAHLQGLPQGWEWLPIWLLQDHKTSATSPHYSGLMRYNFRWDFRAQRLDFISLGEPANGWLEWLQNYRPQPCQGSEWQPQQPEADFSLLLKNLYQQCRQGQLIQQQAVRFFSNQTTASSLELFAAYQAQRASEAHFYYQLGANCYFAQIEQPLQSDRLPSPSAQATSAEGNPCIVAGYYQPYLQNGCYQEHWGYFQQQFPDLLLKAEPILVDKNLNKLHIQQQQQQQQADRNRLFEQIPQI